jgi:ornithine cyclodeaminase/alanine dehydrogenase-like protein (mu-crystallin family)
MTRSLLALSSADVARITSEIPLDDLINLMAFVFSGLSLRSGLSSPHRTSVLTENHNVLFMPARIAGVGTAIKVVGVPTSPSDTRGLPASTFVIDEGTGAVKAIVNARKLTALRNAAGKRYVYWRRCR